MYLYEVKKWIHKIVSPLLALLVLMSTVSWTVDKHLCMGRVIETSFFLPAGDCGMQAEDGLLGSDVDNHCCADDSFTLLGLDDLKLDIQDFELSQIFPPEEAGSIVPDSFLVYAGGRFGPWEEYPPPIPQQDLQVLYGVFLI